MWVKNLCYNRLQGRPEWLPEKFGTPQDLLNAYNQLEQQYTQVSQQQQDYQESQISEQEQ